MNEGELLSGMSADTHACTRAQATAQPLSTVKVAALLSSLQEGEELFLRNHFTNFHQSPFHHSDVVACTLRNMVKKNGSTGATAYRIVVVVVGAAYCKWS